jgi:DNA-directed RNA polymerase specialized sigma24 family protein
VRAEDRADDEAAFEAFVAARSGDLLRTAVLLTRDRGHAEDLLQTALVKAYGRWRRIDGDPYPYVRRVLVTSAAS